MRKIDYIFIHCTATKEGMDFRAKDIDKWHKAKGWKCIGYNWVIDLDGTIEKGRDEKEVGAHCSGYNKNSIGVVYVGGLASDGKTPKDTRTPAQKEAMWKLVRELITRYPDAQVKGHNEVTKSKACPCFDVKETFKNVNLKR